MILPIKDKIKSLIVKDKVVNPEQMVLRLRAMKGNERLSESVQILTELKENSSQASIEKLMVVYAITLVNASYLAQNKHDRSRIKLNNRKLAESMHQTVEPYYRVLFDAYKELAIGLIEHKADFIKEPHELALFFGRLNIVAYEMLIWRYFDNQPTPESLWAALSKVYQYAELVEVLNVPATFPENREMTDLATLYCRVLMFGTLEKATLNPKDLRVAAEVLKQNLLGIEFESEYQPSAHHFYVNLNDEKHGAQYIRATEHSGHYRYWRTAELIQRIENYLLAISMQKLPKDSVLRQVDSLPVITRVLKRLNQEWSSKFYKRQRRGATRKSMEKTLYISRGLNNIAKQLTIFNGDDQLDMRFISVFANNKDDQFANAAYDDRAIEKWKMVDVSETGFAVDLGISPKDWIEPGRLIGCQNPNDSHQYVIAEIKTIKKQSNSHYRAGIEILSNLTQAMDLLSIEAQEEKKEVATGFYLEGEGGEATESVPSISCLYIPQSGTHNKQKSSLILPLAEYQPNKRFKIDAANKMIQLGGAIDIHQDWVRAFVRII